MLKFLKQISLDKVLASTVKRIGLYATEYAMSDWVAPSWISVPVRFTALTAVGTTSKELFWWVITPTSEQTGLEQTLVFEGSKDALEELDFVIITPSDTGYDLDFKTIKTKLAALTEMMVNQAGQHVLNITLGDVIEGTGAMVGSKLATGAFIVFMGAPSLLSLPAYLLLEGTAKSVGAFCGKEIDRYLHMKDPWTVEGEIDNFEWVGTPPPSPLIVRHYDENAMPVMIENYEGNDKDEDKAPVKKQCSTKNLF